MFIMYVYTMKLYIFQIFSKFFLGQAGDSRFEGRDRVKYTREQILELREVIQFCNAVLY